MPKYIVAYDLRTPGRDYKDLYEKLKGFPSWAKLTESTWLIHSEKTSTEIRDDLNTVMDSNDRLFVAGLNGTAAWRNTIAASADVKDRL